ncbi:PREDICTED: CMRF35-like molecule 7 [Elephantulus edwardii]|uniref:CMRF35-like molecule 7 n=1 Tax=Elephantulus edwardii TaxID=28737 RepID=UPI0003F0C949|nr:PREDICTED: CMRF35-like molecule 7 [Elephantulus edwardii]
MWLSPALLLLSLPGCFSIQGPKSVKGLEQGSVSVQCRYDPGWESYRKWWCQGKSWDFCTILIESKGSEEEVKKGRLSIRDNHRDRVFTVTIEPLHRGDAGTYWCGIRKSGPDLGFQVKVTVGTGRNLLILWEETTSTTPTAQSLEPLAMSSTSYGRTHFILLVFVKVPILLILLGAILWLKGSQRVPEVQ